MVKHQNISGRKSVPPFKKQPFREVLQSRCPKKLCNIHRKALVLRSSPSALKLC